MVRLTRRLPFAAAFPLACLLTCVCVGPASAHVKWFCAYDVAGQPDGLENVLCPDFEFLTGLSILALMTGSVLEGTPIGFAMLRALDRATRARPRQSRNDFPRRLRLLLHRDLGRRRHSAHAGTENGFDFGRRHSTRHRRRACCRARPCRYRRSAFSFCSASASGITARSILPIIRSSSALPPISRWSAARPNFFGVRPLDVLRWAAGITLMWASIEKWAYPEWSYPLFIAASGNDDGLHAGFLHAGGRRGRIRAGLRADLDAAGAPRRGGDAGGDVRQRGCSNSARSI